MATARDVACCWSGGVRVEPLGPGVATGADVPTLARGRLVSGGRPERSWAGRVDSRVVKIGRAHVWNSSHLRSSRMPSSA